MTAITHDSDGLTIWKQRSLPSLKRNRLLLTEMRQNMIRLADGRQALRFSKPRARRVIEKMVRGLFYKMYERPLGKVHFRFWFNPKVNLLDKYGKLLKVFQVQGGTFQWAVAVASEDPGNSIWWLEFHRTNMFVVGVTRTPA